MKISTLTVGELILLLQEQDEAAQVVFSADYGDYHHTIQALPIRGLFEERQIKEERGYSSSGFALVPEDYEDDEPDEDTQVLVIT